MQLLFISGPEIMIVALFALLFFGAKQLPSIARTMGKGMKEFKKATEDIKKEFNESDVMDDVKDIKKNIEGAKDVVTKQARDIGKSVDS